MNITNKSILDGSLAAQLCLVEEDVNLLHDDEKDYKLAYNLSTTEQKIIKDIHNVDIKEEFTLSMRAEICQNIDQIFVNGIDSQRTSPPVTLDFKKDSNESFMFLGDRFTNIVNLIKDEVNTFDNKDNLCIITDPKMVSILQCVAKSVFVPAVEGSFKGPSNSMLVGTLSFDLDGAQVSLDVYSFLWELNSNSENSKILILEKNKSKMVVPPQIVNLNVKQIDETFFDKLESCSMFDFDYDGNSVRKIRVITLSFI